MLAACGYPHRALYGHELATRNAFEIGDRWSACLGIASLGHVAEQLGEVKQAEFLYRKAISLGRRLDIPSYLAAMLIQLSRLLLEQGRASEARPFFHEAHANISRVEGERLAGEDTRFEAQVLGIRLHHALGLLTRSAAVVELRALLNQAVSPAQQMAIYYEIWRLAPNDPNTRLAAVALCQSQHALTGAYEYRKRYLELTGETLPDPPGLPDVSDLIPVELADLDGLLDRLEPILAGLDASFV